MMTSSRWLFLTDFATYKPTFIPQDDPADFYFFFDSSATGTCCLAPERIVDLATVESTQESRDRIGDIKGGEKGEGRGEGKGDLLPSMDIFSLGCVLAELFLEYPLFDFPSLLRYRAGENDPLESLLRIPNQYIQNMILHMLNRDPSRRFSASKYILEWDGKVFPKTFRLLHRFLSRLMSMTPDRIIRVIYNDRFHLLRYFAGVDIDEGNDTSSSVPATPAPKAVESGGLLSKSREKGSDEMKRRISEYSEFLEEKDTFGLLVDTEKVIQSMEYKTASRSNANLRKRIPTPTSMAVEAGVGGVGGGGNLSGSGGGSGSGGSLSTLGNALRTRSAASKYFALGDGDDPSTSSSSPSHSLSLSRPSPSPKDASFGVSESPLLLSLEDKRMAVEMENESSSSFSSSSSSVSSSLASSTSLTSVPSSEHPNSESASASASPSPCQSPSPSPSPTPSPSPSPSLPPSAVVDPEGNPLVILLGFVSSHVRSIQSPVLRRMSLDIFAHFAPYVDDECRLQHLLPYTVTLLSDSDPIVRIVALRTLTNIVSLVETFPSPTDADIFPEYLLPSLAPYVSDKEEIVRVELAGNLARLAEAARSFLEKSQFLKHSELLAHRDDLDGIPHDSYDAELLSLQNLFLDLVTPLLSVDRSPAVKRTILRDITRLCIFFGGATTNHFLLPLIITFLNEGDWGLRDAFFQHIPGVATFVGMLSLERFILPCLYQVCVCVCECECAFLCVNVCV